MYYTCIYVFKNVHIAYIHTYYTSIYIIRTCIYRQLAVYLQGYSGKVEVRLHVCVRVCTRAYVRVCVSGVCLCVFFPVFDILCRVVSTGRLYIRV